MRLIINNIFRSVKNHPKANFVILLNMILCTMTVFVLLQNYYFLRNHFDKHYGYEVARHYGLEMSNVQYMYYYTENYPELTIDEFANFREVRTTGMGKKKLYRSSSPIVSKPLSCPEFQSLFISSTGPS